MLFTVRPVHPAFSSVHLITRVDQTPWRMRAIFDGKKDVFITDDRFVASGGKLETPVLDQYVLNIDTFRPKQLGRLLQGDPVRAREEFFQDVRGHLKEHLRSLNWALDGLVGQKYRESQGQLKGFVEMANKPLQVNPLVAKNNPHVIVEVFPANAA